MKINRMFFVIIMAMSMAVLAGCGSDPVSNRAETVGISETDGAAGTGTDRDAPGADVAAVSGENQMKTEKGAEQEERNQTDRTVQGELDQDADTVPEEKFDQDETDDKPKEAPQLPGSGRRIEDFVPDGWELLDSAELDFNEDGVTDYVGVLQAVATDEDGYQVFRLTYPRILFAIASEGKEEYRLDFQDENVIRKRDEGGIFGDPYQPLTAEGKSFTTHTYGGSAWRWWEDFTYTYREGTWWLTSSEEAYGYGDYITDYEKNDWESGVGIRKERSADWGPMEENFAQIENGDWDLVGYDLEYEVPLDKQMTLEQAGKRWWLAPDRVTDWEVKETVFAADVEISEDGVELPGEAYIEYCDENCALYTFRADADADSGICYLAMYGWQDQILSVLAQEEAAIGYPKFYDGKIYYSSEIAEDVTYRTTEDGTERITETEDTVGIRLNRMEPDGTGKEVIFEYRYLDTVPEIMENKIPYVSMLYEISGGEIVAEVYLGGEAHPFYRMKTDGSRQERIGQVPK